MVHKDGDNYVLTLNQDQAILVSALMGQLSGSGFGFGPYHELTSILDGELGEDNVQAATEVVRAALADQESGPSDDEIVAAARQGNKEAA